MWYVMRCDCEATSSSEHVMIQGGPLKGDNYYSHLQEGCRGRSEELNAGQLQLSPWKDHAAHLLRIHLQTNKGQEDSEELQRADQPWPFWLLSLAKFLAMRTREDQWIWYTALSDFTRQSHQFHHCKTSPAMHTSHKYLSSAAKTPVAAPASQDHSLLFSDTLDLLAQVCLFQLFHVMGSLPAECSAELLNSFLHHLGQWWCPCSLN